MEDDLEMDGGKVIISLGKDDAAFVIRNTKSMDECGIELVIPKNELVSPYTALIVALAKRIHDQAWVQEQLDFLDRDIEEMNNRESQ